MTSYVKFELEDGTVIYIESADVPKGSSGLIPAGRGENIEHAAVSFEKSVDGVRKMASTLMQKLRSDLTEQPEEVSINFGLKASAELGNLIVARGGMEANYNVAIRWKREDKTDEKKEDKKKAE